MPTSERMKEYWKEHPRKKIPKEEGIVYQKKALINRFKDVPCAKCGIRYPTYVMDLHHRNPEEKATKAKTGVISLQLREIVKELIKCDALCANCHRITHHEIQLNKKLYKAD
jgi:hypothetical protein